LPPLTYSLRAVELAKLAILHSNESWQFGDTLAAALAENGEFSEAMRALTIAMEDALEEYLPELQKHMLSYQERKAWRE
jgi:hypothetical protein